MYLRRESPRRRHVGHAYGFRLAVSGHSDVPVESCSPVGQFHWNRMASRLRLPTSLALIEGFRPVPESVGVDSSLDSSPVRTTTARLYCGLRFRRLPAFRLRRFARAFSVGWKRDEAVLPTATRHVRRTPQAVGGQCMHSDMSPW